MNQGERNLFLTNTLDVFEWENLPEGVACELALNINRGTPMSGSEQIRVLTGFGTPRARVLRGASEVPEFKARLLEGERDRMVTPLSIILRHWIDPAFVCGPARFEQIKNFYSQSTLVRGTVVDAFYAHLKRMCSLFDEVGLTRVRERHLYVAHLGLRATGCDVLAAMLDGDAEAKPEEVVKRWTACT